MPDGTKLGVPVPLLDSHRYAVRSVNIYQSENPEIVQERRRMKRGSKLRPRSSGLPADTLDPKRQMQKNLNCLYDVLNVVEK